MKKKRKFNTQPDPELLFITDSSQDDKGRRVLVRDPTGPENWIWPPGADDMDVTLLGISEGQTKAIEAFFVEDRT